MKKISVLLISLCIAGCFNSEKQPSNWQPMPYHMTVDCCVDAEQVNAAIRLALIKRDWQVLDAGENMVYTHVSCFGTDADVIFYNTDRYYDIVFENVMEEDFNNHDCIYEKTDDINYVIGRYLKKASARNAKMEAKAAKKALKQKYNRTK